MELNSKTGEPQERESLKILIAHSLSRVRYLDDLMLSMTVVINGDNGVEYH